MQGRFQAFAACAVWLAWATPFVACGDSESSQPAAGSDVAGKPAGRAGDPSVSGGGRGSGGTGSPGGGRSGAPTGGSDGPATAGAGTADGGEPTSDGGAPASSGGAPASGGRAVTGGAPAQGAATGTPPPAHYLQRVRFEAPASVDVLFVVDNSRHMAEKQALLAEAVPAFLERLANPGCFDSDGAFTFELSTDGVCSVGMPEFAPVRDLHLGVVTSSLGDMGSGDACFPGQREHDDRGQLIPSVRDSLPSWNEQGFLSWDPEQQSDPPGSADTGELAAAFSDHVFAAGEDGCGYEASLEAWYRFLVDPEPPETVTKDANMLTDPGPSNATLLAQRKAFLRPDSVVAIVMLTDENDCSIIDYGQGWIVGLQAQGTFYMPRATSACARDPNDPCCASCSNPAVPSGCTAPSADAECLKGQYTMAEDHPNLRCFEQKRRFGFDLLHPTAKYVEALTRPIIQKARVSADGSFEFGPAQNGLLDHTRVGNDRLPSMVFLAGIIGVPWQDVSDDADWHSERSLRFLSHDELVERGRWDWMLGSPSPADGLMYETTLDRSTLGPTVPQEHPAELGAIAPSNSSAQDDNPINGHESNLGDGSKLQTACTFPLRAPIDCSLQGAVCDCNEHDTQYNHAVCDGLAQTHGSAYPSTRQLEVLKAFGDLTGNTVVGSICAKVNDPPTAGVRDTGYVPALDALVTRMQPALQGHCIGKQLPIESDGSTTCHVIEWLADFGTCDPCDERPGRKDPDFDFESEFENVSANACLCEIEQFQGDALRDCRSDVEEPAEPGFCLVTDQPALLADCPPQAQRVLRFGPDILGTPDSNQRLYLACLEDDAP